MSKKYSLGLFKIKEEAGMVRFYVGNLSHFKFYDYESCIKSRREIEKVFMLVDTLNALELPYYYEERDVF